MLDNPRNNLSTGKGRNQHVRRCGYRRGGKRLRGIAPEFTKRRSCAPPPRPDAV
eukprot:COSAG04_NODE_26739_length_291_cov_0.979167_1_plen_53_part_10